MQQSVQAAIDSVAGKYTEKRTGLFQVEGRFENGTAILSGRVLEKAALVDIRRAMEARIPKLKLDDSAVHVRRRDNPVKKIVATNISDLHTEPSFLAELLTQILNGQSLEILEEREQWSYIRQDDGYLGWAYTSYLGANDDRPALPTHMVSAPAVRLLEEPESSATVLSCLVAGTQVAVTETRGDWAHLQPAGRLLRPGWALASDFRLLGALKVADPAAQMIADARRLTGVYYLWGGATSFGLDCSALAQLSHRLSGYSIPRDAYMQFTAGKPVEPPYLPGDLLYFHSDADKHRITHVGMSLGGWEMIHSSRFNNGVYEEDVETASRLFDTFAGARTFIR